MKIKALSAIQRRPPGQKVEEVAPGTVFEATQAEIDDYNKMRTPTHPIYTTATEEDEAVARRLEAQGIKMVQEVPRLPRRNPKTGEVQVADPITGLMPSEQEALDRQKAAKDASDKAAAEALAKRDEGTGIPVKAGEQTAPAAEPASGTAVSANAPAKSQAEKPVRTRRTRAQIEADEAAEAAAKGKKPDDDVLG